MNIYIYICDGFERFSREYNNILGRFDARICTKEIPKTVFLEANRPLHGKSLAVERKFRAVS